MMGYQLPSRAQETAYCRRENKPKECDELHGMDPKFVHVPRSHVNAQKSTLGQYSGRGLFAAQDIPKNGILGVDAIVKSFHVFPSTVFAYENLNGLADRHNVPSVVSGLSGLRAFVEGEIIFSFAVLFYT
jgi:hypothetical protein